MWDAAVASTIRSVFFCAWNQSYWPRAALFFFFDREAPDCCERIFCGIPGCCTGSQGLGALWQLPRPRTCPGRIPVLLHLSRSGACVNLERASCWQGPGVHAVPTQAPPKPQILPIQSAFYNLECAALLPHWEPGPLCKKKKKNGGKNQNWLLIELPG